MNDVSDNSSVTVSEEFFVEDHEGTGTDESIETEEGTEEIETESYFDVSGNDEESTEEKTEEFETVEGESVPSNEGYIFETVNRSDDNISVVTDYSNYFSFLIAVVLGLGAVICWAKGFTE